MAVPAGPRLYSMAGDQWARWQNESRSDRSSLEGQLRALRQAADAAISKGPWSVVDSPAPSPTGDKRTYDTLSRYWWPDPAKPNGLPYIRKDGRTNPQVAEYPDEAYLNSTIDTVSTLAHAYSLLGDEGYAQRATFLINHFFTDPQTGMLPNFTWAQFIPGRSSITGDGILDSRGIIRLLDGITLLRGSAAWTELDDEAMQTWLTDLLDWLVESSTGQAAAAAPNNHGTWYDDEVTALALYLGRTSTAVETIAHYAGRQLEKQIKPNGEQPLELARTNSWDYSTFNLVAATNLAMIARSLGVDLYTCSVGNDHTSIAKAVQFLVPYATGERHWPYQEIGTFDASRAVYPLYMAATAFSDEAVHRALGHVQPGPASRSDGLDPLDLARIGHTQ
jgi:hypothetical protein